MKWIFLIVLSVICSFNPSDNIELAKDLISRERYDEAITKLKHEHLPKARYYQGWCYMKLGQCEYANEQFGLFINTYIGDRSDLWKDEARSNMESCDKEKYLLWPNKEEVENKNESDNTPTVLLWPEHNEIEKLKEAPKHLIYPEQRYESIDLESLHNSYILCQGISHENIWESRMRTAANGEQSSGVAYENIWESRMRTAQNETGQNTKGVAHENIWESKMIAAPNGQDVTYHICNGVAHENIWESKMIAPPGSSITDIDESDNDIPTGTKHENVWESKMIASPSGDQEIHVVVCNGVAHENVWESRMRTAGGTHSYIIKLKGVANENIWESRMRTAGGNNVEIPKGTKHENVWESKMIAGPNGTSEIVNIICDHESHFHLEEKSIRDLVKDSKNIYITCNGVSHENVWESRMRTASTGGKPPSGVSHENIWESRMRTAQSESNPKGVSHENVWESRMRTAPNGKEVHYHFCNGVSHENIWESRMRTAPGSSITDIDESDDDLPTGTKHENVWESKMITVTGSDPEIHVVVCNGVAHENVWESRMRTAGSNTSDIIKLKGVSHENIWESRMRTDGGNTVDLPLGISHENIWESRMIASPSGGQEIINMICNCTPNRKAGVMGGTINCEIESSDDDTVAGPPHEEVESSVDTLSGAYSALLELDGKVDKGENVDTLSGAYTALLELDGKVNKPITEQPSSSSIVNNPMTEQPSSSRANDYSTSSSQHHYKILFSIESNPDKEYLSLSSIGPVTSKEANAGNYLYYVGFYNTKEDADKALKRVKSAGHPVARIMEFNKGELQKEHKEINQQSTKDKIESKEVVVSEPIEKESKPETKKPKPQIEEVVKSEVISYHILFRVLDNPFETFDELKSIGPLYRETFDDKGNSRYLIGNTDNINEARSLLAKVKEAGYKASFVAEYKDGSLNKILQE